MAAIDLKKVQNAIEGSVDFGPDPLTGKAKTVARKMEEMFGVTEQVATIPDVDADGRVRGVKHHVYGKKIDPQAAKDLDGIGPESYGRAIMGSGFESAALDAWHDPTFWARAARRLRRVSGQEDVAADAASQYEPINTWGSFTLGLYDMKILQGYTFAERIYEKVCPTVPTMMRGAQKHAMSDYDGTVNLNPLGEGQTADTVSGKPAWAWSQPVDEFQLQWAISMEATMSDLSGGLARRGEQVGESLAKAENYRAGQVVLGYDNKFCWNTHDNSTPSCNTFQGTAGSAPFNFVNLFFSDPLADVDTLNTAYLSLLRLTDPVRGWRLDPGTEFILLVSPSLAMKAAEIVKLITSYRATQSGISTSNGRLGEGANPLILAGLSFEVVSMGMEWMDVLSGGLIPTNTVNVTSGPQTWINYQGQKANSSALNPLTQYANAPGVLMSVTGVPTTGNADGAWALISKKRPFVVHEPWMPIRSEIWPLSADDMARRTGIRGGSYVASRNTVLEPRAAQMHLPLASGAL